jgi:hypothetical protein
MESPFRVNCMKCPTYATIHSISRRGYKHSFSDGGAFCLEIREKLKLEGRVEGGPKCSYLDKAVSERVSDIEGR